MIIGTLILKNFYLQLLINQVIKYFFLFKETKEGINKIFDLFDEDGSNTINLANLRKVAKELGETMSNDELAEMLERAAQNGKEITREDFYNIMTKKTF